MGRGDIKAAVLEALQQNPRQVVTVAAIAEAAGIERKQATSALHNLADHDLNGELQRVGSGTWRYMGPTRQPERAVRRYEIGRDTDLKVREVDVGWTFSATIVTKMETSLGVEYIARTNTGTLIRLVPYFAVESSGVIPEEDDES